MASRMGGIDALVRKVALTFQPKGLAAGDVQPS
jgi:hypothetical protein